MTIEGHKPGRQPRTFLMVIKDNDKGEFTVRGPMTDDRSLNKRVAEANATGRHITCSTGPDPRPIAVVASEFAKQSGYRYVSDVPLPL